MSDNKNTQGNSPTLLVSSFPLGNEEVISESKQILMPGPARIYPESPRYQKIEPIFESK